MPRLSKEKSPYEDYKGLIFQRRDAEGKTWSQLADSVGMSRTALMRRIEKPETMTLDLMRRINRVLAIPADKARAALPMW